MTLLNALTFLFGLVAGGFLFDLAFEDSWSRRLVRRVRDLVQDNFAALAVVLVLAAAVVAHARASEPVPLWAVVPGEPVRVRVLLPTGTREDCHREREDVTNSWLLSLGIPPGTTVVLVCEPPSRMKQLLEEHFFELRLPGSPA